MRLCKPSFIFLFGTLLMGSGCGERVRPDAKAPKKDFSKEWRSVVKDIRSRKGIDFETLKNKKKRKTLNRYLAYASIHGQHTDSWKESHEDKRLSFLLNVHNAMVLHNILRNDMPESPDDVKAGIYQWPGAGFYWGTKYKVDSEWTSIGHLALHDTVNRYQEPLLWIALHDGTRDSSPLHWWSAPKLQSTLKSETRRFVNSERGLRQTETGWAANPLFFKHEDDFIVWTKAENLCDWMLQYASGPRKDWLTENKEACPLEHRAPNRNLDLHTQQRRVKPQHGQPSAN